MLSLLDLGAFYGLDFSVKRNVFLELANRMVGSLVPSRTQLVTYTFDPLSFCGSSHVVIDKGVNVNRAQNGAI